MWPATASAVRLFVERLSLCTERVWPATASAVCLFVECSLSVFVERSPHTLLFFGVSPATASAVRLLVERSPSLFVERSPSLFVERSPLRLFFEKV